MSREVRRLGVWEEGVSVLTDLEVKEGVLFAGLNKFVLILPIKMEEKMLTYVGKRVALLHTDVPGREYLFRVVPDQENSEGGA